MFPVRIRIPGPTPRLCVARRATVAVAVALTSLTGAVACSTTPEATSVTHAAPAHSIAPSDCEPVGPARPVCQFENPEDMVPLPGNRALLIGEYGTSAEDHAGGIVLFDLASEARRTVYAGGTGPAEAAAGWGDPACRGAPDARFNSHGIDLVRRDDGKLALLVVQHGSREAVEFFEVEGSGVDWSLTWRGCVESPEDASLNEVAALPDGGFYTTKMASLSGAANLDAGFPTEPTGMAFHWTEADGFRVIGGSEAILPNGITASPDGRFVYMNSSGENHIRKIEVATGREWGRAPVIIPDNVTWSPDGRLLIASLRAIDPEAFGACQVLEAGACTIPFSIEAVDPETMQPLGPVYESTGRPMGAGTVGLQVGDELFIGSFRSDRIVRVDLGAK